MCNTQEHEPAELGWGEHSADPRPAGMSRRGFLSAALGVGTIAFTGVRGGLWLPATAAAATNAAGLTAYRHAMHVHSSYSEGGASLQAQIVEAIASGCHVLHTTDHDWRMSAYSAPDVFHFATSPETVTGRKYSWRAGSSGSFAAKGGGIVGSPVSPFDAAPNKGSLKVEATSAGTGLARHWFALNGGASNNCHRTNIGGQSLQLDVYADSVGLDGWGELLLTLSYRPPLTTSNGTRQGGIYKISYRFGTASGSHSVTGTSGIVTILVEPQQWTVVQIDPAADIAALWPDVVAADNVLGGLSLGVGSRRRFLTRVFFGNLRFSRSQTFGDEPLQAQQHLITTYRERYPQLQIAQGVEVSGSSEHANWFFTPGLTNYTEVDPADAYRYTADMMHAAGGLASINHPFGGGGAALRPETTQDDLRRQVASNLLSRQLGGVDILETGFRQRAGVSLETHLDLTATTWRNGYWVTANGVNDNHAGTYGSWLKETNRFFTGVWQSLATPDSAYEGLRRGAVFVGELGSFGGALDLNVDAAVAMGTASVRPDLSTRTLLITALDLPGSATIELIRGPVDYSGALDPGTVVVATLPGDQFVAGPVGVAVDTATSCFVYVTVVNSAGRRVAFSNPVFLLRESPPAARAIPEWRRAPDSKA